MVILTTCEQKKTRKVLRTFTNDGWETDENCDLDTRYFVLYIRMVKIGEILIYEMRIEE